MDKPKKEKHCLKQNKNTGDKTKTIRSSATKTPKHPEQNREHRSPQLSKFKSLPSKPKRQISGSILPPELNFIENECQANYKTYKTNKTNTTTVDIPYSNSQKTLQFHIIDNNHKSLYKIDKTNKKKKNKTSKYDLQFKTRDKETLTSRKSSTKRLTLDTLFRKTDRILKKYQKRQQEWLKERANLIEQIEQLKKRKNTGRTLTSSASSYIQKRLY